jgi:hypothetical protein
MMRFVMLLIILVSFRHRTESSSYTEGKKGNENGFHILSEYGCCEMLGRVCLSLAARFPSNNGLQYFTHQRRERQLHCIAAIPPRPITFQLTYRSAITGEVNFPEKTKTHQSRS